MLSFENNENLASYLEEISFYEKDVSLKTSSFLSFLILKVDSLSFWLVIAIFMEPLFF